MKKFTIIIILSIIATFNAAYLTWKAYGVFGDWKSFCDINDRRSCANVVNHPAAYIGPIPFPAVALVVYPVLIAIAIMGLYCTTPKRNYKILTFLSLGGILFNSYFIYQETFVIKAYCPLCLMCTVIIITIFALSLSGWKGKK